MHLPVSDHQNSNSTDERTSAAAAAAAVKNWNQPSLPSAPSLSSSEPSPSPEEVSTLLICAPGYAVDDADAFAAACTAITTNLKFVRADYDVSLVFFHPKYDRDRVAPDSYEQAHGHLPPVPWLRAYAALDRGTDAAAELTDDALLRANAQRTSPFFMINVLRTDQVEAAESVVPWEVIEPEPGRSIRVSGARVYAKNIWRFADAATTKVNKFGDAYLVATQRGATEPKA